MYQNTRKQYSGQSTRKVPKQTECRTHELSLRRSHVHLHTVEFELTRQVPVGCHFKRENDNRSTNTPPLSLVQRAPTRYKHLSMLGAVYHSSKVTHVQQHEINLKSQGAVGSASAPRNLNQSCM